MMYKGTMYNVQCTKVIFVIAFLLSPFALRLSPLFAQSNVTYEVKVGTQGEVKVLQDFPESYAAEKVNISIQPSVFSIQTPWTSCLRRRNCR